jgi:hypothetical protein
MPINFPSSPNTNDLYVYGDVVWIWTGSAWSVQSTSVAIGPTGPTGPTGATGPTGSIDSNAFIDGGEF